MYPSSDIDMSSTDADTDSSFYGTVVVDGEVTTMSTVLVPDALASR
jgi:hypothetical protein